MHSPQKLTTLGTQDEDKRDIKKTQCNMCSTPLYTRHRMKTNKTKKHNTIFVGHTYTQTNTNNVNKT